MGLDDVSNWFLYTRTTRVLPKGDPFLKVVDGVIRSLSQTYDEVCEACGKPTGNVPAPSLSHLITAADLLVVLTNLFVAVHKTKVEAVSATLKAESAQWV